MDTHHTPDPSHTTTDFAEHRLVDTRGEEIGTITDVVYGDHGDRPEYLVVDPGMLRSERAVPVTGCAETPEGDIQVPYSKGHVRKAPKIDGSHVLSDHDRRQVDQHFATVTS